jgi:hypothetical protein
MPTRVVIERQAVVLGMVKFSRLHRALLWPRGICEPGEMTRVMLRIGILGVLLVGLA